MGYRGFIILWLFCNIMPLRAGGNNGQDKAVTNSMKMADKGQDDGEFGANSNSKKGANGLYGRDFKSKEAELVNYIDFLSLIEGEINALRYKLKQPLQKDQIANLIKQLDRLENQVKKVINEMDMKYMMACKVRRAVKKGHKHINLIKMKYRAKK